ncbi:MAG: response regulator transcription factor [Salinivirgaceae bacterium]|nr:response regulator transcription factor [Salinivirgaceae bacterium]
MNSLNALIIDDERPARKELLFLLKTFPEITVVGEADNIADASALIVKQKPDIVFLDIQLAGENGFDLLSKIPLTFKVIFVTAFNEYAIRAFEVNATDYLLKPVDPARLELSLKRILENTDNNRSASKKFDYSDSIYLKLNNHTAKFIEISSIIIITSVGNYTKLETIDGNNYIVLKTMKQWEDELPLAYFVRIHRSNIANIKFINKIENYSKTYHRAFMVGIKEPMEISRNCLKNLKRV